MAANAKFDDTPKVNYPYSLTGAAISSNAACLFDLLFAHELNEVLEDDRLHRTHHQSSHRQIPLS
jgi:hypothetical protein